MTQKAEFHWHQLHIVVPQEIKEDLEDYLWAMGALSITEQSGDGTEIFEKFSAQQDRWNVVKLTSLFDASTSLHEVYESVTSMYPSYIDSLDIEKVEDEDWNARWLSHFRPLQISDKLWICPSWLEAPDEDALNILIDPGMAFGTGTHETTKGCLKVISQINMADKFVIDYGCGSGILSIAAAKLGASKVSAIDIDPRALVVSKENFKKNNLDIDLHLALPEEYECQHAATKADIVIANILSETLILLAESLVNKLSENSTLVLSGILSEQADKIITTYNNAFSARQLLPNWEQFDDNQWVVLVAKL